MKRTIALLSILIMLIFTLDAQVTSVKYLVEYNDTTSLYDCKLVIMAGETTTIPHRIQFNAQYAIRVPHGVEISIEEFHNPIQGNNYYLGTEPMEWEFGLIEISHYSQPDSDFYAINPNLGITSAYNDLKAGDTITLFSILADIDPCENEVNTFDYTIDNHYLDYMGNGFTLGSIDQIYYGHLISLYGESTIAANDTLLCQNAQTVVSSDVSGLWDSSDPSILSLDPNTGVVTANGVGTGTITFTEASTGCINSVEIEVLSTSDPFCLVSTDDEWQETIQLFPNPARGHFTLESNFGMKAISIYSMAGEKVEERWLAHLSHKIQVSTDHLEPGLYVILIETKDRNIYKKLIVE